MTDDTPSSVPEFPSSDELLALARRSADEVTPWEAAVHEAGHAVAWLAVAGYYPDLVYLNADPADESHAGRTVTSYDPTRVPREHLAAVLYAGDAAVSVALGRTLEPTEMAEAAYYCADRPDHSTDEARLAQSVQHLHEDDALAMLEAAATLTAAMLGDCWDDVQSVAAQLIDRRELDLDALRHLLADSTAASWEAR